MYWKCWLSTIPVLHHWMRDPGLFISVYGTNNIWSKKCSKNASHYLRFYVKTGPALEPGGGCIFIYLDSARLISFEIIFISKETDRKELEYMNIHPPINALALALCIKGLWNHNITFDDIFNFIGCANSTMCDLTLHKWWLVRSYIFVQVVKLLRINEEA